MPKFAKLIELSDGEQVLLTVNYNDDEEFYNIIIRTDLDNCVAQLTVGGITDQENANTFMEEYSLEKATQFRNEMVKTFS